MVSWNSQVDDTVVESDVLFHNGTFLFALFGLFFTTSGTIFSGLVGDESACILNLERKDWCRLVDDPKLLDDQLNFLRAGLNWGLGNSDLGFNFNNGLSWDLAGIGDHAFRDDVVNGEDSLDGRELLSDDNEAEFSLGS